MASLRTHDVVVADGTFRVVVTPKRRVIAVIDARETMLGPLHIAFEVDRSRFLPPDVSPTVLEQSYVTSGMFDDIGHAVSSAAKGAFQAASNVATTVARPAVDITKAAAGEGAHLLSQAASSFPDAMRRQLESAANVVMRAKLGDLGAKQFIKTIASAANSGVQAAQHVGDTLIDASKIVAKTVDVPVLLAGQIPVLGNIVRTLSPLELYQHMATAVQKGDFKGLEKIAQDELSLAQSVVSLVPGVGTGISAALGAGLAALEGGSPLDIAIRTAYGAIPIPPGIRQITDTVLDAVLALVDHPNDLSEVVIQVARDNVPSGLPRDVFDTLINLVAKHQPIQKAAGALVDHYVRQYAPVLGDMNPAAALQGLGSGLFPHLPGIPAGRMIQPLHVLHG
jgi:hypothetical protein